MNSQNLINHWSMYWARFKDPVSHMCRGTVVASWSLIHYVAGPSFFNDKYFYHPQQYVFTSVCHSFCPQGWVGVCIQGRGPASRKDLHPGELGRPPNRILWATVNKCGMHSCCHWIYRIQGKHLGKTQMFISRFLCQLFLIT